MPQKFEKKDCSVLTRGYIELPSPLSYLLILMDIKGKMGMMEVIRVMMMMIEVMTKMSLMM
jgi:hypothetical protein